LPAFVTVEFERMIIDVEDVLKLPRCPGCGLQRTAYQPALVRGRLIVAAHDYRDRDDVFGIGRVTHSKKETESKDR